MPRWHNGSSYLSQVFADDIDVDNCEIARLFNGDGA